MNASKQQRPSSQLLIEKFTGLVAAPFTPFHADFGLNLDVIPNYAALLRGSGVSAVFVCGSTGEGFSMSLDERMRTLEAWLACAGTDLKVIAHVGHNSLPDACALARHASKAGVAAISAMAPSYFRPQGVSELVGWCQALAAAGEVTPFYYYHIPSMSGVNLPMLEFLIEGGVKIPTLAGIKFTHNDLPEFLACTEFAEHRYDILFGRDELLIEGLKRGALGAVGSTYNYAAPLYKNLIAEFRGGHLAAAQEHQNKAIRMIEICNGLGVTHLAASKAIMKTLGVDCGPVRPPLLPPTPAQQLILTSLLKEMGFFNFACKA